MKFHTKAAATAFGEKILKQLKGKGWMVRVWENIGWHVAWHLNRISLHVSDYRGKREFSALISEDDDESGSGSTMWSTRFHSEDPNEAVLKHLNNAIEVAEVEGIRLLDIKDDLERVKENLTGKKRKKCPKSTKRR